MSATAVDDYLGFLVELHPPLDRDHVMRPQSWYLSDLKTGEVLVKRLFLLGPRTDAAADRLFLRGHGVGPLTAGSTAPGAWAFRSDAGAMPARRCALPRGLPPDRPPAWRTGRAPPPHFGPWPLQRSRSYFLSPRQSSGSDKMRQDSCGDDGTTTLTANAHLG